MMFENINIQNLLQDQQIILALIGAVIVALSIKLACLLKQDYNYMDVINNNYPYLIAFSFVGSLCFIIFKFNLFFDVKIMQDPQDQIGQTPISMFGVGGIILGISYGLELMNHIPFKIQNLQDILRFIIFMNVAKYVRQFVEVQKQIEGITFILDFDYKTYNIIMLAISSALAIFFMEKKYFIGLLLGLGILISQVFQKDQLYSQNFLIFVITFNLLIKILRVKQDMSPLKKKKNVQKQQISETEKSKISLDEQKSQKNNQNTEQQDINNTEPKKKYINQSDILDTQMIKNDRKSGLVRVLISSGLGGLGYGLCGILPEYAILNVAVFSPHITLVYLISFVVGFTLMVAIMAMIQFDLSKQVDKQLLDEYKQHIKDKNQLRQQNKKF